MPTQTITADSKPVYCWFGGSDCWTCNDLIAWHIAMVAKYGKDVANTNFINSFANDTPIICEQLDCRSFNSNFREYFKKVGILGDLYNGIGVIAQPIGVGTDLSSNVGGAIENVGKGAENLTAILKYTLPALVVVAAIIAIAYAVKQLKLA